MTKVQEYASTWWKSSAIRVIDGGVLGARTSDILLKMQSGIGSPDPNDPAYMVASDPSYSLKSANSPGVGGLRTYLPERVGQGYWDFIEVCPGLFVSITDAIYRENHCMALPAEKLVKIRVVCSGSVCLALERPAISAGSVTVQLLAGNRPTTYSIHGDGSRLRMVVLHILPEALQNLGIKRSSLPVSMRSFIENDIQSDESFNVEFSAKILRIAREMLESRDRLLSDLRQTYVRGKAQELLCESLLRVRPNAISHVGRNRFRHSDIVRLHEAKRILASQLHASPTIEKLSRLVGVNRSKLKAGFRELFGETVQEYRNRVRLAEALRLIEDSDLPMAEIGRRIGIGHPANFSQVVKRHFGATPLELRKRNSTTPRAVG